MIKMAGRALSLPVYSLLLWYDPDGGQQEEYAPQGEQGEGQVDGVLQRQVGGLHIHKMWMLISSTTWIRCRSN